MSTNAAKRKAEHKDYSSVAATVNPYQPHLHDTSTQTVLAGHKNHFQAQIFNPPRDLARRKANYTARAGRRKRVEATQKLPRGPSGTKEGVEDEYEDGDEDGDEDGESDYENAVELQGLMNDIVVMTPPSTVAPSSSSGLWAEEPSTTAPSPSSGQWTLRKPGQKSIPQHDQLLDALIDAERQPVASLERMQNLLQGQIKLLKDRQVLCKKIDQAIEKLRLIHIRNIEEQDTLNEGVVESRLQERDYWMRQIKVLRAKLSVAV